MLLTFWFIHSLYWARMDGTFPYFINYLLQQSLQLSNVFSSENETQYIHQ